MSKDQVPSDVQVIRDWLAKAGLSELEGARQLGIDADLMHELCSGESSLPKEARVALQNLTWLEQTVHSEPKTREELGRKIAQLMVVAENLSDQRTRLDDEK